MEGRGDERRFLTEYSTSTSSRLSWSSSNLFSMASRYSSASWWYWASVISVGVWLVCAGSSASLAGCLPPSGNMAILRHVVDEMDRSPLPMWPVGRAAVLAIVLVARGAEVPAIRAAARGSLIMFVRNMAEAGG